MIFKSGKFDWYEHRCVALASTQEHVDDPYTFESTMDCLSKIPCFYALDAIHKDGLVHKGHVFAEQPDEVWVVEPKIKLVDICVRSGLVPSKNEFRRKVEQKGLKYMDKPVTDFNMEIDASVPNIFHTVRLGRRYLEIVVPFKMRGVENDEDCGA